MAEKKKCCVRWSTAESRAAGQISVLAIVEMVFAVALYWGIAFYFDTHFHLVTSLFVAPLLLLRSERSIEAGADWFRRDWFNAGNSKKWSLAKEIVWLGIMAMLGFAVSWWISDYLAHSWLEDQTGLAFFLSATLVGIIGISVGSMVGIAMTVAGINGIFGTRSMDANVLARVVMNAIARMIADVNAAASTGRFFSTSSTDASMVTNTVVRVISGANRFFSASSADADLVASAIMIVIACTIAAVGAVAGTIVALSAIVGAIAAIGVVIAVLIVGTVIVAAAVAHSRVIVSGNKDAYAGLGAGIAMGSYASTFVGTIAGGYAIRAIIIRLSATLRFLFFDGTRSLPQNWRENNFVIDGMTPAELVPGIGKDEEFFTLSSVIDGLKRETVILGKIALFPLIPIWFIPVFLYRLNIKATCWFYWPLAFLLRPLPSDERSERRRRDLCWPWTNPAQLLLIIGSGVFGLVAVFISLIGTQFLLGFTGWSAVPFWLEYLFILDWSRLEPWHWANLMIAVTGAAMLWMAGKAVADYKAGLDYSEENPWSLPTMHILLAPAYACGHRYSTAGPGFCRRVPSAWLVRLSARETYAGGYRFLRIE